MLCGLSKKTYVVLSTVPVVLHMLNRSCVLQSVHVSLEGGERRGDVELRSHLRHEEVQM